MRLAGARLTSRAPARRRTVVDSRLLPAGLARDNGTRPAHGRHCAPARCRRPSLGHRSQSVNPPQLNGCFEWADSRRAGKCLGGAPALWLHLLGRKRAAAFLVRPPNSAECAREHLTGPPGASRRHHLPARIRLAKSRLTTMRLDNGHRPASIIRHRRAPSAPKCPPVARSRRQLAALATGASPPTRVADSRWAPVRRAAKTAPRRRQEAGKAPAATPRPAAIKPLDTTRTFAHGNSGAQKNAGRRPPAHTRIALHWPI